MLGSGEQSKIFEKKNLLHVSPHTLRILALFWHPPIGVVVGAYKRFVDAISYHENYDVEYDVIENKPTILPKDIRSKVYSYRIPFNYSTYSTKLLTMIFGILMMIFLGVKACRKKRYDFLITPVGELTCSTIPAYVTHLITNVPWTSLACNVPEAYAVIDSSGQLVMSITKIYGYYRSLKFSILNSFLMACYSFFPKIILPKIYSKTKAILCVNRSLSLYLQSLGTKCKIFGVGTGFNVHVAPNSNIPCDERHNAIFLGRFVPEKGIFDALKVWRKVVGFFPKATLALAGYADEVQISAVKNMIKEFNLSENVKVLGTVDEDKKFRLLRSSDLFLYLGRFESFPNVVAEAMAYGLPVVSYDVPYIRELFSCPAVLRAPIGDIDSAAMLVCALMRDYEKRRKLSGQALEYVKRFDWNEIAKREVQIYYTVLNMYRQRR